MVFVISYYFIDTSSHIDWSEIGRVNCVEIIVICVSNEFNENNLPFFVGTS